MRRNRKKSAYELRQEKRRIKHRAYHRRFAALRRSLDRVIDDVLKERDLAEGVSFHRWVMDGLSKARTGMFDAERAS